MYRILPLQAFKDNYIWMIVDDTRSRAIAVDPGDAAPVETFLTQNALHLDAILITHHHFDHSGGIPDLVDRYSPSVYAPKLEALERVTHPVEPGTQIIFSDYNLTLSILDIHAHTRGHVAYYGNNLLFCGDTLFSAGCGRLFEGTPTDLYHALNQFLLLSDSTEVYCGHEYTLKNLEFAQMVEPMNQNIAIYLKKVIDLRSKNLPSLPSTLKLEKTVNPFLRFNEKTVIQAAEDYAQTALTSPIEVLAVLREWKNRS